MSRPAKGTVEIQTLSEGTRAFKLRFYVPGRREHQVLHERRNCNCGCGGSWNERTAAVELDNVLARVRAGVWRKRNPPPPVAAGRVPTFHEYASAWLQAKIDGVLGDRPIGPNTQADYRSRLSNHLLPFFGDYNLDEIDAHVCLAFKTHKLKEAAELRRAIEAGAVLRDRGGRRVRPLGPAMIRKLTDCLTTILDEAVAVSWALARCATRPALVAGEALGRILATGREELVRLAGRGCESGRICLVKAG